MNQPPDGNFQQSLLSRMQELEKGIKGLRVTVGRVRSKLTDFEVLDLQQQVNSLADRLEAIEKRHLLTRQYFTEAYLDLLSDSWVRKFPDEKFHEFREFVYRTVAGARTEIKYSSNPEKILSDAVSSWLQYANELLNP